MSDLVKRLTIKAGVIEMGEKIAWGSDTALMREAAARIEELQSAFDNLSREYSHRGEQIATLEARITKADALADAATYFSTAFSGKNTDRLFAALAAYRKGSDT
jgi:uncharacterized protein YbgA (DUF1722 family)